MSSLMLSVAIKDKAPYRQVLTHGFTVDEKGRKMSKSLGNVIAPQEIWDKMGADVLRLWIATNDYTGDIAVSHEIFKRSSDAYRRIRNTLRFLLANLNGFNPETDMVPFAEMVELDKWAVSLAKKTQESIINYYDNYDFHLVVKELMHFCSIELGSFYLDIIKDRQYTAKADSLARRSCQSALYLIAECLVRWIAPILSFTAQEVWEVMPGKRDEYVFTAYWFKHDQLQALDENSKFNSAYWERILAFRDEANRAIEQARNNGLIGGSLEAEVKVFAQGQVAEDLKALGDELRFVLITSKVTVSDEAAPADAFSVDLGDSKVAFVVTKSQAQKCERCWHYEEGVGQDAEHPTLCPRCLENILRFGEKRLFA